MRVGDRVQVRISAECPYVGEPSSLHDQGYPAGHPAWMDGKRGTIVHIEEDGLLFDQQHPYEVHWDEAVWGNEGSYPVPLRRAHYAAVELEETRDRRPPMPAPLLDVPVRRPAPNCRDDRGDAPRDRCCPGPPRHVAAAAGAAGRGGRHVLGSGRMKTSRPHSAVMTAEHELIGRLFVLANRQVTKTGHLGLVNYLESRGGCSRERCALSCLEMQATIDDALDYLEAQAGAAAGEPA